MSRPKGSKNLAVKKQAIKKTFEVSAELKELAEKVIDAEKLDVYRAKICYLRVDPNISKSVAGRCIRTGKELKFFSTFDYLIEVSGELWDTLNENLQYILMQHELMHIHTCMNEKSGEWEFKIRDHDVQDFSKLIKKHGVEWLAAVKLSVTQLHENVSEDDVKI